MFVCSHTTMCFLLFFVVCCLRLFFTLFAAILANKINVNAKYFCVTNV